MAYFRENEKYNTRQQPIRELAADSRDEETEYEEAQEYIESDYDDGFDDPEAPEEELTEEERNEIRKKRFRLMSGAGNLTAVITGTVVILVLLALLMSMISFVVNDMERNFTLLQTRF